jgi:RimJ/RimL family protein N-acetyltransferase
MLRVFFEESEAVAKWVMDRLGQKLAGPYWAIGVTDGREICGGVVLNDWNGANIGITIYGPGCMRKTIIRGVFSYVFKGLEARRITARTLATNDRMAKILPRLGFVYECRQIDYFEAGDALQYRMLRDEWLGSNYASSKTAGSCSHGERPSADEQRYCGHAVRTQCN